MIIGLFFRREEAKRSKRINLRILVHLIRVLSNQSHSITITIITMIIIILIITTATIILITISLIIVLSKHFSE